MELPKSANERVEQSTSAGEITRESSGQPNRASLRTLGRYEIQEELGRGAMGAVYKAFDPLIARTVALKTILINDHAPDRAQMIERLKQEAKAAGGLDHPNIITIYDVGEENGAVYLSMQYVKGTTLAELLAEAGVPSLETLLSWADQISAAVGFAHARGVIHRDLKPANLMVTEQGAIKVLDFGIAKIENTSLTQTGLVVGTPSYMSPEQIAGKKVDHRSDIFSLGAVFYELLTREKAFDGEVTTVLYKIVNEDPVAPSLINPAIPGGIDAVIRKALAKDPRERFQSCEEMRKAFLERSVGAPLTVAAGAPAEKTIAIRPPDAASARRGGQVQKVQPRIWPRLAVITGLVLIAAVGWVFYVRSRTGAFPPVIAEIETKIKPALRATTDKPSESSTPVPNRAVDAQSVSLRAPQNAVAADVPATQAPATQAPATQTSATQTAISPAAANPVPVATAPAIVGQSGDHLTENHPLGDHPSGDHSTSESTADSAVPASLPPVETRQNRGRSSETLSTQTSEPTDSKPATADKGTAHESPSALVASREDERQSAFPPAPKPPARKRAPESALTVDGFSRQDVPDLLRQAESSRARGKYRLARYEYGLVLKLDRNNVEAREGLRSLPAVWQSR